MVGILIAKDLPSSDCDIVLLTGHKRSFFGTRFRKGGKIVHGIEYVKA